jgi:hypothetical protein
LKFEDKIMRNVLKEVHLDKSSSLTLWCIVQLWHYIIPSYYTNYFQE